MGVGVTAENDVFPAVELLSYLCDGGVEELPERCGECCGRVEIHQEEWGGRRDECYHDTWVSEGYLRQRRVLWGGPDGHATFVCVGVGEEEVEFVGAVAAG